MWGAIKEWFVGDNEHIQYQLRQSAVEQSVHLDEEMKKVREALEKSRLGTSRIRRMLLGLHEQVEFLLLESCDDTRKSVDETGVGEGEGCGCTDNSLKMQLTRGALLEELQDVKDPLIEKLLGLIAKEYELEVRHRTLNVHREVVRKELLEKIKPEEVEARLEHYVIPPPPVEVEFYYESPQMGQERDK